MIIKKRLKIRLVKLVFGLFLIVISMFGGVVGTVVNSQPAYAVPETENVEQGTDEPPKVMQGVAEKIDCKASLGAIGWFVCPAMDTIAKAVDWLYWLLEDVLVINPVAAEDGSPIYEMWKYCRGITNIVFIIFLLIVIYSQITGLGISNYGIKRALPKLIIAAVLMNLSFLICLLLVDLSNAIGNGLRGVFMAVSNTALLGEAGAGVSVSTAGFYGTLGGGLAITLVGGAIAFGTGAIWMLIPLLLGAVVSAFAGLFTIALRQAVVALLTMISPLAMVAYILPNTENLFKKWKDLLTRMLVFYPMFSLLFGASQLAGFAIIMSAKNSFILMLGMAVQVFPLFFSWKLMQMSGTFLGDINAKIRGLAATPLAANRAWADSHRQNRRANTLAHGVMPSAKLMQFLDKRRALREKDTEHALSVSASKASLFVQRKISDTEIGDTTGKHARASRYVRHAKASRNYALMAQNAEMHTDHVMGNYGDYFGKGRRNKKLAGQAVDAWLDYGRATNQKEMDDENDMNFLTERFLEATRRDANNRPIDEVAFKRYISSVAGPDGEQRLIAKIVQKAAKVESKQRAEFAVMYAKYGHNGYNKTNWRNFITGYLIDDDGWAVDEHGKRLRNDDGSYVEIVQGDAITKAPEKLVLYNQRDEQGLYYDFKDQDGNIIARVHRGVGDDGKSHDDAAFIKETFSNFDIPIADPINNVYSILAGVKAGSVDTPQGKNEIGLARYSTTIGRAMSEYKSNAAWAGSMFNSGIGNRQIKNSSQLAIWVLDSIKKTLKPGAFNTQNPASVEYLMSIFDPDNWDKIFTEEELIDAVNINNELVGGENWITDDAGNVIDYVSVENPTYEQRMNRLKRKLLFPAMKKVLPAFDRLRTSNTADNQKPGTADVMYKLLKMVEDKWENNPTVNFDPTLVDQDLQSAARAFRQRKHDKNGELIYDSVSSERAPENLLEKLQTAYDRVMLPSDLQREIFSILGSNPRYSRALARFSELCDENPDATMQEIASWFTDLDVLV